MNRVIWIAIGLLCLAGTISLILWLGGYPPSPTDSTDKAVGLWRQIITAPLGLGLIGLLITIPIIFIKRSRLLEDSKTNAITESAILFMPILILGLQVIIPLKIYGLIQADNIQFLIFMLAATFFLTMGNTIVTVKFDSNIGLRNKWTLSDPAIWTRTHRFLGRSLVIGTGISLLSAVWIEIKFATFLLVAISISLKGIAWLYSRSLAHQLPLPNS